MTDYKANEPVFIHGWLEVAVGSVIIMLFGLGVSLIMFTAFLPKMVREVPHLGQREAVSQAFSAGREIVKDWAVGGSGGLVAHQNGSYGVSLDVEAMDRSGGIEYGNAYSNLISSEPIFSDITEPWDLLPAFGYRLYQPTVHSQGI